MFAISSTAHFGFSSLFFLSSISDERNFLFDFAGEGRECCALIETFDRRRMPKVSLFLSGYC